jgi:hypothetical protein
MICDVRREFEVEGGWEVMVGCERSCRGEEGSELMSGAITGVTTVCTSCSCLCLGVGLQFASFQDCQDPVPVTLLTWDCS